MIFLYFYDIQSYEIYICIYRISYSTSKKRAPRALKAVREFVKKEMGTEDVRIDTNLNKYLWSRGICHVPSRVRVRVERKRSIEEEAKYPIYSVVSYVAVPSFKGLETKVVE